MKGGGNEFLAAAALALDQHRGIALRNLRNEPEEFLHTGTFADDIFQAVRGLHLLPQDRQLLAQTLSLKGLIDHKTYLVYLERLVDKLMSAEFHCFNGGFRCSERRDHDDKGR